MQKKLYNHITVILFNKKIPKMTLFSLKWQKWLFAKPMVRKKAQKRSLFGPNFKEPKIQENQLENHIAVVLCKKGHEKAPHVVKMTRFSTAHFGQFFKLREWQLS